MSSSSHQSRRGFLDGALTTGAALWVASQAPPALALQTVCLPSAEAISPDDILQKLLAGNQRYHEGRTTGMRRTPADFARLAEGQKPLAIIVGCADSRVPPEILFDQGVGDLFVVRVAGNIVHGAGPMVKGSIEYAIAELGVTLVMVLGHSNCGAVKAAMQHIDAKDVLPGAINDLVNTLKPAVLRAKEQGHASLKDTVRVNVVMGVERLKALRPILDEKVSSGAVKVVGGVYDLAVGKVELCA